MRADDLSHLIDRYLDAAPRSSADEVSIGPFSVFVTRGPWGYYARPSLPVASRFSADEVEAVTIAQRARGQSVAFEWLVDTAPGVGRACVSAGLVVTERPLLVCDPRTIDGADFSGTATVEVLSTSSPDIADQRRVANVAFAHPGTSIGRAGPAERDVTADDPVAAQWSRSRIESGQRIAVVARHPHDGIVGVGSAIPVEVGGQTIAELVGIAVLSTHRRQGVAAAITRTLTDACVGAGAELVLLSAADAAVARIYERVGFRHVATFAEAALPA